MSTTHRRSPVLPWLGLALLVIPAFAVAIDMTVLFLALPSIAAELLPTGTQQLWVLHIGDLVGAGLVLSAGRLVDRFGPRRLLGFALLAYGAASLAAALSPSVELLIAARFLLGASGVAMMPAAMALARQLFPDPRRFAQAVAILMAAFSGGMALGPPLGGVLLEHFWWGSVFLVNVPMVLVVLLGLRLLPRVAGTGTGRVDVPSVLLSLAGTAGLIYGVQELLADGWAGLPIATGLGGIGLLTLFVLRQRTLADPLLDLCLFRSRPLVLGLLVLLLVIVADAGAELQIAQHLQVVTGLGPLDAGLLLIVPATVSMVATAAAPVLLRWVGPGGIIGAGALVAVAGAVAAWQVVRVDGPTPALLAAAAVIALGLAPAFALGPALVISNAPEEQTGSATAAQEVSGSLGNTLGLALGGSVAYLAYSRSLRASMPAGLTPAEAETAAQSIGGALSVAEARGADGGGGELLAAATAGLADATSAAYVLAAIGFAAVAVLAFVGLRRSRIEDDQSTDRDTDSDTGPASDADARVLADAEASEEDARCPQPS